MTAAERYAAEGVPMREVTYTHLDGRTFTIHRPVHYPHHWPWYGRTVTFEEISVVATYHSRPEPAAT